ncbi:hypothetical protein Tco_1228422 [Tanacetum coccineum]
MMSTSEALAMTQAAIRKLVAGSVTIALEAQVANMANTDNTTRPREAPVARQCSYKEFMSFQPIKFKGTKGTIGLIRWFERTESVFSRSNCIEDCKTYCGIFQEWKPCRSTMVPDSKKMMEVFIGGLPRSIKGNVTASKPQTLKEAINIAQRLMDQVGHMPKIQINKGPLLEYLATSDSYLSCLWRERALCKSVPKDHQQQCPGKSLHAKG